jgi:hypothetical protein
MDRAAARIVETCLRVAARMIARLAKAADILKELIPKRIKGVEFWFEIFGVEIIDE